MEEFSREGSPFKRNLEAGNEIERTESPSKIRKLRGKREYSTMSYYRVPMYSTKLIRFKSNSKFVNIYDSSGK